MKKPLITQNDELNAALFCKIIHFIGKHLPGDKGDELINHVGKYAHTNYEIGVERQKMANENVLELLKQCNERLSKLEGLMQTPKPTPQFWQELDKIIDWDALSPGKVVKVPDPALREPAPVCNINHGIHEHAPICEPRNQINYQNMAASLYDFFGSCTCRFEFYIGRTFFIVRRSRMPVDGANGPYQTYGYDVQTPDEKVSHFFSLQDAMQYAAKTAEKENANKDK